jgi:hypothetical protein
VARGRGGTHAGSGFYNQSQDGRQHQINPNNYRQKLRGDPGIATDAIVLVIGEGSAHFFQMTHTHISMLYTMSRIVEKITTVMLKMRSSHQTFRILK